MTSILPVKLANASTYYDEITHVVDGSSI